MPVANNAAQGLVIEPSFNGTSRVARIGPIKTTPCRDIFRSLKRRAKCFKVLSTATSHQIATCLCRQVRRPLQHQPVAQVLGNQDAALR